MNRRLITLTTDFGHRSGFVGVMKGVILGIAPSAQIVDLSHEVAPHDILEAQFLIERAEPFFPLGTIHVAVVDPGVGTDRRPILVKAPRCALVGPDNGLFTPWFDVAETRLLKRKQFFNQDISATFHGRDIFAPVAGHLAAGWDPVEMGPLIDDPVRKNLPRPDFNQGEIIGHILYVDDFGNLVTNILAEYLADIKEPVISVGKKKIQGIVYTYADASPKKPCALIGSHGRLEVAIPFGNAHKFLGVDKGRRIKIKPGK